MRDYSIFDRFNFERKPVGVSFSLKKPEGIRQLDKSLGVCEMFKEAQTSAPFLPPPWRTCSAGRRSWEWRSFRPS